MRRSRQHRLDQGDPRDGWRRLARAGPLRDAGGDPDRLEAAGFVDVETWLNPEPTPIEPGEPLETYLATVVLGAHLERLPEADRAAFVHEVARRLPRPEIDYVRLNILATRARGSAHGSGA